MKYRALSIWLIRLGAGLLLAAIYYATAELGRFLASTPEDVTAVWPPDGIALAAVLLLGYSVLPGVWLGSFLANIWAFLDTTNIMAALESVGVASTIAAGTSLEVFFAAFCLQKWSRDRNPFERPQDVFKFVVYCGIVAPMISATIGTLILCLSNRAPWEAFQSIWLTWWISNASGILIFTPLLVAWSRLFSQIRVPAFKNLRFFFKPLIKNYFSKFTQSEHSLDGQSIEISLEFAFLLIILAVIGQVAFVNGYPIEYMLIPCLIWSAFRFGQRGTTFMILLVSAIAIGSTVKGLGPFVRESLNESLLLLQTFVGVIALTSLVLNAVIKQRSLAEIRLQKANEQLRVEIIQRKHSEQAWRESEVEKVRLIASLQAQARQLQNTLTDLQQTQAQLVQTEKMSSLGQLVAGVAHEINNPVSFIYGNIVPAQEYIENLLSLLQLYRQNFPVLPTIIQETEEAIDIDFLIEDLPKLLDSMHLGAERIRQIVLSLRNFSRVDEAQMKPVDLHEGLESTLLLLRNRLTPSRRNLKIEVIKEYGDLPLVECYAGQLNQVFMNLLANAIDALEEKIEQDVNRIKNQVRNLEILDPGENNVVPATLTLGNFCIWISTSLKQHQDSCDRVEIRIADNGSGMSQEVTQRLFDPFFTTKPVGKGTGLGLSISYQIVVEKHGGELRCFSTPGQGTEFIIAIPVKQLTVPSVA